MKTKSTSGRIEAAWAHRVTMLHALVKGQRRASEMRDTFAAACGGRKDHVTAALQWLREHGLAERLGGPHVLTWRLVEAGRKLVQRVRGADALRAWARGDENAAEQAQERAA